ncbi:MAG: hypothetical protein RIR65_709, partial [Planctomycetota bacterium]
MLAGRWRFADNAPRMEQSTLVVVLRALLGVAFFIGAAWL